MCVCLLGSLGAAKRIPTVNTFTSIGTTSHFSVALTPALVTIWYLMAEFSAIFLGRTTTTWAVLRHLFLCRISTCTCGSNMGWNGLVHILQRYDTDIILVDRCCIPGKWPLLLRKATMEKLVQLACGPLMWRRQCSVSESGIGQFQGHFPTHLKKMHK